MQLPANLRLALDNLAARHPRAELTRAAGIVSDRYRRQTGDASLAIASVLEAIAYTATRMPATYCAVNKVLQSLRQALPDLSPTTLLDAGAGPATATLAAREYWPRAKATLVEANLHLRTAGMALLDTAPAEWHKADITTFALAPESHDLTLASYVLNEIAQEKGMAAFESTLLKLWQATKGALVIIEPGTPAGYGLILKAREILLKHGANLAAPCPHSLACPLASTQRWCHFSVRVERTKLHREIKPDAALNYEDEKFSYLIATRLSAHLPQQRVIGHPRLAGTLEVDVCTDKGEVLHHVLRKSQPEYKKFRKADWGDGV